MNDYLQKLCRMIKGLIQPSFLIKYQEQGVDDTGSAKRCFFYLSGRAQRGYLFSPYGLCTNPPLGSSGIVFNLNAGDSHPVGMVDYAARRFKDLKSGEVVVGNYETGSYIKFLENGDVMVHAAGNILMSGDVYGATAGTPISAPAGIKAPNTVIDDAHTHTDVRSGTENTGGVG